MRLLTVSGIFCFSSLAATAQEQSCWESAAYRYQVPAEALVAIADIESNMNPAAFRVNKDGSSDIGLMQVNSRELPQLAKYGITRESLFDPCLNIHIGAWILASKINRHGYTWSGFATYHSATPSRREAYTRKLISAYKNRFEK